MKRTRRILLWQLTVIAACVVASGVLSGWRGIISAAVAGAIVIAFFIATPAVLGPIMKASPRSSLFSALVFFATKVIALVALAKILADERYWGHMIDRQSFSITMIISAIAWSLLIIVSFATSRVPIYDLDDDEQNSA